ncbi:MAG: hypothetical protein AAB555_01795 [Patescibacteria group bacterium]
MDTAVQAIMSQQREPRASYRIPDVSLTVRWARYLGRDRHIFIDWQATLDAMKVSPVDAYRALGEQAEQFFREVALSLNGNMPAILHVTVPHAGMIFRLAELGTFYHIRYLNIRCVIPQRIMVGEWEPSTPHPVGKKH